MRLLALCLLIALACFSPTAASNCPLDYDPALYLAASAQKISATSELVYGSVYSPQDSLTLEASFSSGDTAKIASFIRNISVVGPFLVIGLTFAVTFLISVCCCIFQKTCPPCQAWKRDFSKNPYENRQLKCTSYFTLFFSFSIAAVSMVGLAAQPELEQQSSIVKCHLYYSLDVVLNGEAAKGWGGLAQMGLQVSNISALLIASGAAAASSFGASSTIEADFASLRQQNNNIYENNRLSTVSTPNPAVVATAISTNSPIPKIVPAFIQTSLGPSSSNSTMVGDIELGLQIIEKAVTQAEKVLSAANLFVNSLSSSSEKYSSSMRLLNQNLEYLGSIQSSISEFTSKYIDQDLVHLMYLAQGVLALVMVGSFLIFLGALGTFSFQLFSCKTCVHIGWILYGLLYFGVVVLCYALFAVGGVSFAFCRFYGGVVSSQAQLDAYRYNSKATPYNRLFQILDPCFFGNGNISRAFDITSEVSTITSLYTQIDAFVNCQDNSKATYVNLNDPIDRTTAWSQAMEKYRLGIYVDASPSISEDNPYTSLANMNKITSGNASTGFPTCTLDTWVFDKENCSRSASESIYEASPTSGASFVSTGHMCISFNQKYSSSNLNIWSEADLVSRYLPRRQCSGDTQAFDRIMQYGAALIGYRDSRMDLYTALKDQLADLKAANQALNSKIGDLTLATLSFAANTTALNNLVASSVNGASHSSNCSVVAASMRAFHNVFCIGFVDQLAKLGISCVVLLGLMIGGMLTGSVFAVRYSRIEKDPKTFMEDPPILKDEVSSRRGDSSDSSSSDEED